jgi:hypothetical protein
MKVKLKRDDEPTEVKMVRVMIGNTTYRLDESVDGKLTINKTTDDDIQSLMVFPRSGNEIDVL